MFWEGRIVLGECVDSVAVFCSVIDEAIFCKDAEIGLEVAEGGHEAFAYHLLVKELCELKGDETVVEEVVVGGVGEAELACVHGFEDGDGDVGGLDGAGGGGCECLKEEIEVEGGMVVWERDGEERVEDAVDGEEEVEAGEAEEGEDEEGCLYVGGRGGEVGVDEVEGGDGSLVVGAYFVGDEVEDEPGGEGSAGVVGVDSCTT